MLANFHHVAFRCNDAAETVKFYTEILGLKYSHATTNDIVPSTRDTTKEFNPHIHIFFELEDGSTIAFFEVPLAPPAQKDPNTPPWVQHVAFRVRSMEELLEGKKRLEEAGVPFLGPFGHYGTQFSIYFFDPNGHRLELNLPAKTDPERRARAAITTLEKWEQRKAAKDWALRPAEEVVV